jgi:hypothetical protein
MPLHQLTGRDPTRPLPPWFPQHEYVTPFIVWTGRIKVAISACFSALLFHPRKIEIDGSPSLLPIDAEPTAGHRTASRRLSGRNSPC